MKKLLLVSILVCCINHFCNAMQTYTISGSSWSGSPAIAIVANPADATAGEGLFDPRFCIAQTFKVSDAQTTLKLDKIAIWGGNGSTPTQNPYTLRLVDLGTSDPAWEGSGGTSQTYAAGTDLWGGNVTFNYYGNSSIAAILEFDFENTEELILTAGHYYAFELTAPTPVGGLYWYRVVANPYHDGAVFVDTRTVTPGIRNQLYADQVGRDFAMAVYLTPEPTTFALLVLGGLLLKKHKI